MNVVQPFLPPLAEFSTLLNDIWASGVVTNCGAMHQRFEQMLCDYLGVPFISLFNNGTSALLAALQYNNMQGEVITTPYTFVATANAIVKAGLKPVFVDICPKTLMLDPRLVEQAITDKTVAIMPVHCYGLPCDVDAFALLGKKYQLPVIYDAAAAFASKVRGKSTVSYGDMSILSFHATKVFHTFEGGAVVCHSREVKIKLDEHKNFGFVDPENITNLGLNYKLNEISAAMGVLQLSYIDRVIAKRKQLAHLYIDKLSHLKAIRMLLSDMEGYNFSYFPIFIAPVGTFNRDSLYEFLHGKGIRVRKYYFPLVVDFSVYQHDALKNNVAVARDAASCAMCLPLYGDMNEQDVMFVVREINAYFCHTQTTVETC